MCVYLPGRGQGDPGRSALIKAACSPAQRGDPGCTTPGEEENVWKCMEGRSLTLLSGFPGNMFSVVHGNIVLPHFQWSERPLEMIKAYPK